MEPTQSSMSLMRHMLDICRLNRCSLNERGYYILWWLRQVCDEGLINGRRLIQHKECLRYFNCSFGLIY